MDRAFDICKEGQVLNVEQCKLLKLFEVTCLRVLRGCHSVHSHDRAPCGHSWWHLQVKMVEFQLSVLGMWDKNTEMFTDMQ